MNTNLTQDDDSIGFQQAVKSPYKCPQNLLISNDNQFLLSLQESGDDSETFLVVSQLNSNIEIVMSSKFVKRIRYTITPYNVEQAIKSLEKAISFKDENLQQIHQYYLQADGSLEIYGSYNNQSLYLHERLNLENKVISNEIKLRSYLYNILEGLEYIHNQGFVHMNLTVQSIESHKETYRQFKISKLDTVQEIGTIVNQSLQSYLIRSLPLIPPELENDKLEIQPSFDVFCLGVLIFQICTSQLPDYNKRTNSLILRKFVSKQLMNIILSMLEIDGNNRPSITTIMDHNWFNI